MFRMLSGGEARSARKKTEMREWRATMLAFSWPGSTSLRNTRGLHNMQFEQYVGAGTTTLQSIVPVSYTHLTLPTILLV
eukprot:4802096-Pyramimonas_sp.AAC.1